MNPDPRLRWQGATTNPSYNPGCGLLACDNDARAFWQSRMTKAGARAEYPDLVDLTEGARRVRATYPETCNVSA